MVVYKVKLMIQKLLCHNCRFNGYSSDCVTKNAEISALQQGLSRLIKAEYHGPGCNELPAAAQVPLFSVALNYKTPARTAQSCPNPCPFILKVNAYETTKTQPH